MSKGAATRDRILDHALKAASLDGLEGLSLGRLAADVGMSKSGLFAHFESKEELQLGVLAAAVEKFRQVVVQPALTQPRGEPRVRALFEHWLTWERHESIPGGCVFVHAAAELDDRPGPARQALVKAQRQWFEALAKATRLAVEEKHFRRTLDPDLFASQMFGIVLGYYHATRLLRDPRAESHARRAFDELLASARLARRRRRS